MQGKLRDEVRKLRSQAPRGYQTLPTAYREPA